MILLLNLVLLVDVLSWSFFSNDLSWVLSLVLLHQVHAIFANKFELSHVILRFSVASSKQILSHLSFFEDSLPTTDYFLYLISWVDVDEILLFSFNRFEIVRLESFVEVLCSIRRFQLNDRNDRMYSECDW